MYWEGFNFERLSKTYYTTGKAKKQACDLAACCSTCQFALDVDPHDQEHWASSFCVRYRKGGVNGDLI